MRIPPEAALAAVSVADHEPDLHNGRGGGGGGGNGRDVLAFSSGAVLRTSGGQMLPPAVQHTSAFKPPPSSSLSTSPFGPMSLNPAAERVNPGPASPAGSEIAAGTLPPPPPQPQLSAASSGALSRTASRRHRLSVSTSIREFEPDPNGACFGSSRGLELQTNGQEGGAASGGLAVEASPQPLVKADMATSDANDRDAGVAADPEELPDSRVIDEEDLVADMPTSGLFDATTESLFDTDFAQSAGGTGGVAGSALRARPGVSHLYRTSIASSATATPSELAAFDDAFDELMADSFDAESETHARSPPRQQLRAADGGPNSSRSGPLVNGFLIAAQNPFGPSDSVQLAEEDAEDIFSSIASAAPVTPAEASRTQQQQEPLQYKLATGSRPNLSRLFGMPSHASDAADADGSASGAVISYPSELTQFRQASRPLFDSAVPSPRDTGPPKEAAVDGMVPSPLVASSAPAPALTPAPVTTYQEVTVGVSALFGGDDGDEDGGVFGASVGPLGADATAASVPLAATMTGKQQPQQHQSHFQVPAASAVTGHGPTGWLQQGPHGQQQFAPAMQQQQQVQYGSRTDVTSAATDEALSFFESLAAESITAPGAAGHAACTTIAASGASSTPPVCNAGSPSGQYAAAHCASAATASSIVCSPLPHGFGADEPSSFFDYLDEPQQAAHPASAPIASGPFHVQEQAEWAVPAKNLMATALPWQEPQQGQQSEDQKPQSQPQGLYLQPSGAAEVVQQPLQSSHGGVAHQAPPPIQALGWTPISNVGYGYADPGMAQDDGTSFFDVPGSHVEAEPTVSIGVAVANGTPAEIPTQVFTSWEGQQVAPSQQELEHQQGQAALPPPRQQHQQQHIENGATVPMMRQQSVFGEKDTTAAASGLFDGSNFFDNLPDSPRADEGIEGSSQQQESAVVAGAATPVEGATVPARQSEASSLATEPYRQWTAQKQANVHPENNQQQPFGQQGYGALGQQYVGQQQTELSPQPASSWQVAQQQPTYGQTYSHYHEQAYDQPAGESQTASQKTDDSQNSADLPHNQTQAHAGAFVHTSVTGSATPAPTVDMAAATTPAAVAATGDGDDVIAHGATTSNQAASVFTDASTQARVHYDIAASPGPPSPPWTHPDSISNTVAMYYAPGQLQGQTHEAGVAQGQCDDPQAQQQGQAQATWQGQLQGQSGGAGMEQDQGNRKSGQMQLLR
ncbi:hypothetical protein Vretimale_9227 [Volvox reticuliferus]|uniref:Protein transport protein sec16 n=1 Tax=Volvox reticuliferus TaxID=1737510 RepID=A0A8J4GD38_9CHLO|nr:hypothetical protein Vretimale_9227 [Volvox reticuliferus]